MTLGELRFLILSDLARYQKCINCISLARELAVGTGYKYLFWWRINKYLDTKGAKAILLRLLSRYMLRRWLFRLGIDINLSADIGPGLKIEHFGGIFVNGKARIGMRCSILQGVTIGEYRGAPALGDFVFVGPGAKVIGPVQVGNNAIIGANAVITRHVADNQVVVGVPGRAISDKGSIRDDYEKIVSQHIALYRRLCPKRFWDKYRLNGRSDLLPEDTTNANCRLSDKSSRFC
jgi:serine O-acetyltransferase